MLLLFSGFCGILNAGDIEIFLGDTSGRVGDNAELDFEITGVRAGDILNCKIEMSNPTVFYPDSIVGITSGLQFASDLTRRDDLIYQLQIVFLNIPESGCKMKIVGELLAGNDSVSVISLRDIRVGAYDVGDVSGTVISKNTFASGYIRIIELDRGKPNPVSRYGTVSWDFYIEREMTATVSIYNIAGRLIERNETSYPEQGRYSYSFTPGPTVSQGTYIICIESDFGYDYRSFTVIN